MEEELKKELDKLQELIERMTKSMAAKYQKPLQSDMLKSIAMCKELNSKK